MNTKESNPAALPTTRWFLPTHFVVWLTFGAIVYVSDEVDRRYQLWLMLVPLLALPALVALSTFVGGIAVNLWARRWRRVILVLFAPLVTLGLLAGSFRYHLDFDWLRFQFGRKLYLQSVHKLTGPLKHQEWNWGETGGAIGADIQHTLVYDDSDNPFVLTPWPGHPGATSAVRSLGSHFFLVTRVFR